MAQRDLSRREELELTIWDVIVLTVTVLVAVLIPLEVVFDSLESGWVVGVSLAATVVLAWDVALRLGGSTAEQGITGDHGVSRAEYLRSWFPVDVLAAIPFELLAIAPGVEGSSFEGPIRFLALLRVLRILRVFALQRRWRTRTSLNPAVLRLAFFAFWIVLISHWISCGWVALDGAAAGHPELSPYHQAAYWTITTLTTVGYGDLVPSGAGQVAYAMAVMALGAAMYGYIIGNVATLLANLDVARSRHLRRMERVNTFMRDRGVPRDLQARVRDYYNYMWESRAGRQQSEMLSDLPPPLHTEIALHLNRPVLEKVPIFAGASDAVLRELALDLEPIVCVPGQAIVTRGDVGDELFFINSGTVEVRSYDESQVVAVLGDGDFFGEMALIEQTPRSNTVNALEHSNLYTLDRDSFERVLGAFPEFAAQVREIADRRRAESDEVSGA